MKKLMSIFLVCLVLTGIFCSGCLGKSESQRTAEEGIARTMSSVASGKGVAQAAAYNRSAEFNPTVLISTSGEVDSWTTEIPTEWQPKSIAETQQVVCVHKGTKSLETCRYSGGPPVTRYQYYVQVELREAKTGKLIQKTTLYGSEPIKCRWSEEIPLTALYGSEVSFGQLKDWLQKYVVFKRG